MTEKELDELIEQKKAQHQAIEFDRTEEEFVEDFIIKVSSCDKPW